MDVLPDTFLTIFFHKTIRHTKIVIITVFVQIVKVNNFGFNLCSSFMKKIWFAINKYLEPKQSLNQIIILRRETKTKNGIIIVVIKVSASVKPTKNKLKYTNKNYKITKSLIICKLEIWGLAIQTNLKKKQAELNRLKMRLILYSILFYIIF